VKKSKLSWLPIAVLVLAVGFLAINLVLHGAGAIGWRAVLRATARTSLIVFLGVYLSTSLVALWPARWSRVVHESYGAFVLALAASHGVHFVAIVSLALVDWGGFSPRLGGGVAVGALAYLALAGMAFTAHGRAKGLAHRVGPHLLWLAFIGTLATRTGRAPHDLAFIALLLAAATVRATAWWRARQA